MPIKNENRPPHKMLSFGEAMDMAPIDINLKADDRGTKGIAFTIPSHIAFHVPMYRNPELLGAWLVGYLTGLGGDTVEHMVNLRMKDK